MTLGRALVGAALVFVSGVASAGGALPPWTETDDLPLPSWAKSVIAKRNDEAIYALATRDEAHRGSVILGARLPLFGAKRGPGCGGRWLLIGPMAWICSDVADLSADDPYAAPLRETADGLPFRYFWVGKEGASGFLNLARVEDDAPEQDLEAGWGVAIVEQRMAAGELWGRTRAGVWIAMRELGEARAFPFHGEELRDAAPDPSGILGVAWVVSTKAGSRERFARVAWREERAAPGGPMVRVEGEGSPGSEWVRAKDLAHPTLAAPPAEVTGADERWIDVDLATQTLIAYEGARPVYATLVSTGIGAPGSPTATPPGVHRIWVKLLSSNMGNLENEDADAHYSIEDVPYVQFFDKGVALHGAFWHRAFGRVHSHGCVNLAPLDARWLFAFTSPRLVSGWSAALPVRFDQGTVVRVR